MTGSITLNNHYYSEGPIKNIISFLSFLNNITRKHLELPWHLLDSAFFVASFSLITLYLNTFGGIFCVPTHHFSRAPCCHLRPVLRFLLGSTRRYRLHLAPACSRACIGFPWRRSWKLGNSSKGCIVGIRSCTTRTPSSTWWLRDVCAKGESGSRVRWSDAARFRVDQLVQ